MRLLKQSTAANVMVLLVDSTDHVTGKTGLTLTVTASKDGAAFASITPTVTERGVGWYLLSLTTTHTNTLGDLVLHVTGTGADPTDLLCRVIAVNLADSVRAGLTALPNVASDASGGLPVIGGLNPMTTLANVQSLLSDVDAATNLYLFALTLKATDGSLTGLSFDTDAIKASAVKADAVTKIQAGLVRSLTPANALAVASDGSVNAGVTLTQDNIDDIADGVAAQVSGLSTEQAAQLTAIENATAFLGSDAPVNRPPYDGGVIRLAQGSGYPASMAAVIILQEGRNWPTLTGYTIRAYIEPKADVVARGASSADVSFVGTVSGTDPDMTLSFRPTATITATLIEDGYGRSAGASSLYEVWAEDHATLDDVMLVSGVANVVRDVRS
jgi:hypothetical protein